MTALMIPTETIGSIPRREALIAGIKARDGGQISDAELGPIGVATVVRCDRSP